MALTQLSDMMGYHTLLDWSNGIISGNTRFFQSDTQILHESYLTTLVYFFLNKISPFTLFCIEFNNIFYLVSGQNELYTMHQFINGMCGISKEYWPFSDTFPSNREHCF